MKQLILFAVFFFGTCLGVFSTIRHKGTDKAPDLTKLKVAVIEAQQAGPAPERPQR